MSLATDAALSRVVESGSDNRHSRVRSAQQRSQSQPVVAGDHAEEERAAECIEHCVPHCGLRPAAATALHHDQDDQLKSEVAGNPHEPRHVARQHERQMPERTHRTQQQPGGEQAVLLAEQRRGECCPPGLLPEADEKEHCDERDGHVRPVGELRRGRQRRAEAVVHQHDRHMDGDRKHRDSDQPATSNPDRTDPAPPCLANLAALDGCHDGRCNEWAGGNLVGSRPDAQCAQQELRPAEQAGQAGEGGEWMGTNEPDGCCHDGSSESG